MPNPHKIYIADGHKIHQSINKMHQPFSFRRHPKNIQIGVFWYANIPSGNPGTYCNLFLAVNIKKDQQGALMSVNYIHTVGSEA
jgi:hypothetical protein